MCGIAFVINYGKEPTPLDLVKAMFTEMETRGTDASGIYYERPDKDGAVISRVFKAPVRAKDLWAMVQENDGDMTMPKEFAEKFKMDGSEKLILLHTRAQTHGTYMDNNNNMPIYSDDWALVHNGVVYGEPLEGYKYKGKVDSEEILAGIQLYGDVGKAINRLAGSMAILARPRGTKSLFIYRNTNPFELVAIKDAKLLFGCSMDYYVTNGMDDELMTRGVTNVFNMHNVFTSSITPNKLYRLDTEEAELEDLGEVLATASARWNKKEGGKF